MQKTIGISFICLLQLSILSTFILSSEASAITPTGDWFIGCFPDSALLTAAENVFIPGDMISSETNLTEKNAMECGIKCTIARESNKYGAFSQTGACLCIDGLYMIPSAANTSQCMQKTCDMVNGNGDCDGNTYHWLVNASKLISKVSIVTPSILSGAVPQNITVQILPEYVTPSIEYRFGDGTSIDLISAKTINHIYLNAGFYKLTVIALSNTVDSPSVSDAKIMQVEVQPTGVDIDIPAVAETELTYNFTCSLVEGNNITVDAEVTIGTRTIADSITSSLSIDDASLIAVGASSHELLRATVVFSSPNSGIYIMPKFKFPASGIVAGFEVFVTKIGFLRFQAFRPICSTGKYCYASEQCSSECIDTVEMMNATILNATSSPSVSTPSFKLISEISLNSNATGLKYLKAKSPNFAVERGDVLAIKLDSNEGDIGHATLSSASEYHASSVAEVFPGSVISSLTTKTGKKHLIRAHLSTTSSFRMAVKFTEPGLANVKIKATNPQFPLYTSNKYVQVLERISGFKVTVPLLMNETAYEVQKRIAITSTCEKGSNLTYEWRINKGNIDLSYNSSEGTLDFTPPSVGIYTLFASVRNLLGQENITIQFRVQERVAGLVINGLVNGVLIVPSSHPVIINVTVINGTNITLTTEYEGAKINTTIDTFHGEQHTRQITFQPLLPGVCKVSKGKVTAKNMIPSAEVMEEFKVGVLCPIGNFTVTTEPYLDKSSSPPKATSGKNSPISVTVKLTQGSYVMYYIYKGYGAPETKNHSLKLEPEAFTFTLNYPLTNEYIINITAENVISTNRYTFVVDVSECPPELLEITGSPEPLNPTMVTRGLDYKVTGTATPPPNCTVSGAPTSYSVEFHSIDQNEILDNRNVSKDQLVYLVPRLSQPAGKYKILFMQHIQTPNGPQVNKKTAYLTIKQTPLLAMIDSGSSRQLPLRKLKSKSDNKAYYYIFYLDGSLSYDPDDKRNKLENEWMCRSRALIMPSNHSNIEYKCNHTDFRPYQKSGWKSKMAVNTSGFVINATYEFLLRVSFQNRTSNYTQKIFFVRGSPPAVEFECITNCKDKWNIQEKLILRGKCPGCIDMKDIRYKWQFLYDTGGPVFTNPGTDVTSTGFTKQNFVIHADQLEENKGYAVILEAYYYDAIAEVTKITMSRRTSILPHSGYCTMLPMAGFVAKTQFQIRCQAWDCPDLPLKYEFRTKTQVGGSKSVSVSSLSRTDYPIWYSGYEPRNPKSILPLGDANDGYNLTMIVRIFNAYGSFREIPAIMAKVENVPTSEQENLTSIIDSSKPKTNDASALAQWTTSVSSIMNAEGSSSKPADLAETRLKIIKSLGEGDLNNASLSVLQQYGEALDSALAKPSEVNEESQEESTNVLGKMAERFLNGGNEGAAKNLYACTAILSPLQSLMDMTAAESEKTLQTFSGIGSANALPTPATANGPTQQPTKGQLQTKAQKTKVSADKYISIMDKVSEKLLQTTVPGEVPVVAKTTAFSIALEKRTLRQLANGEISTGSVGSGFALPDDIFNQVFLAGKRLDDNETEVSCQGTSMKKILHTWDLENAQNSASEIESLKLASRDYSSMNVSNLTSDITIKIKNRPEKLNTSIIKLTFPQEMSIRKERIKSYDSPLLAEFGSPDNSTSNFTILIQFGLPPTLENYDAKLVITSDGIDLSKGSGNVTANFSSNSNTTLNGTSKENQPIVRNPHIRVIDSKTIIMWDFQSLPYGYLGNKDVYFTFFYTGAMPDPVYVPNPYTFDLLELTRSRNYSLRTFSSSCLYWNSAMDKWTDDGCKVDPYRTTFNNTVCKCNHLTSFGGFYVKPNPIPPLSADMFLKGYVLFVAVTVALAFFILGLVLARRADKGDLEKVGVCPLPDNNPEHHYVYQITVWTGLRRGGGTKSNVYFILSGDKGDTEIRHLKDPVRTTFQQNSSDLFIFNTESSLGDLSHIRIWHDNSGGGWYLRKVVVTDIQTDKTFQFLCNRWLAVDKDDGQIEMVAPVSGKEDLKDFNYVFMAKTRNDLGDSHLWFSLYARPPRSPFTRCQRLACCVSLLMTSMMASAMFYNTFPKPDPQTANYAAGLQFTWKQVYVALVSAAITVPINIVIVTLFRSSKPVELIDIKEKNRSRVGSKASLADNASVKSADSSVTIGSPDTPMLAKKGEEQLLFNKKNIDAERGKVEKKADKKKETYLFPHWCIYVAWFITFGTIVASSVVVIMYGMVFGNSKSLEWLTAIIIGFVQDIIVIQPIKIFIIAIAFAAIVKTVQDERSSIEEHGKKLAEDEEWLHAHADTSLGSAVDTSTLRPPDGVKLDAMRELRFKERKMYAIVREILLYSLFVLVTFSISYALREETGFWQTYGLEKEFKLDLDAKNQFKKDRFTGVLSQKDFWTYSSETLVDTLFPRPWYPISGYPQTTRDFPGKLLINDLNHKIVNGVRLRQVRVKPASCQKNKDVKNVIKIECLAPYTMENEEKTNFISNWTNQIGKRPAITHDNQQWLYQHWDELDGYPFMAELATYFGGGYTQEMFPRWNNKENLDKLKNSRWLDRHTRAVIIEFALFNPHTNHFSMVTITFEFAATGGCIHHYSIYTFKLYRYTTGYQFFVVVCEVLFVLLLLVYLYRECKELYQLRLKYFTQFWNIVEATIYGLSFVAIGFYVYRQKLANDLLKKLPSKNPQTFINFQFAAYIDQVFIYIVALIVFFVSIKFIKLLRFNRRMSILADTLKHSWKPLGMFSIVMGIVLTSTFAFATIVFGRQMYGYRNMLVTAATQISLLLGKFDFNEYQNTNRVIGPIFFFLYIIMVNWILLNMFLSIINDSFEVVSADLQEQSNDYEIVDFITDQFKAWLGVGKTRKEEIAQNIRWQNTRVKFDAVRAFSANSKASKKSVRWCDDDVLSGLTRSSYWHENPAIYETKDLETDEVNRTVDRFIECINILYFDDSEVARKMTKKVKQEISDYDYLEQEKARKK